MQREESERERVESEIYLRNTAGGSAAHVSSLLSAEIGQVKRKREGENQRRKENRTIPEKSKNMRRIKE
jgi:hypothetical protein